MYRTIAVGMLAATALLPCNDALAVAQRTFVSTAGADANSALNCSLANPCRSFGTAMTVTAASGEIVVLDSGGYGRVTVDKSVTIAAPAGVYAGISVFAGTNGVDVLTDNLNVALRGLTINGQGGNKGINVTAMNIRLRIESCLIANLVAAASYGVYVSNPGGDLSIKDTIIRDNKWGISVSQGLVTLRRVQVEGSTLFGIGLTEVQASLTESAVSGSGSYGIRIDSFSSGGAVVAISDTSISGSAFDGVAVYLNGADDALVAISRSTISGNSQGGAIAYPNGAGALRLEIIDSTVKANALTGLTITRLSGTGASVLTAAGNLISGNGGRGIRSVGNDTYAIASRNTITMNTSFGLEQASSAVLESSGDNIVRGNNFGLVQTAGTITPIGGL
jgi:hypothetical protein